LSKASLRSTLTQLEAQNELLDPKRRHFRQSHHGSSFDYFDTPTRSIEDITKLYEFERVVGRGAYGKVYKCHLKKDKQRVFAVKNIQKCKCGDEAKKRIMMEIEMLKVLDHPGVIRFYEVYEDLDDYFLVLEFLDGGDLLNRLQNETTFTEKTAKNYIFQILLAINYLHNKNIVHMDLKPENFMFTVLGGSTLKMIDFGLSQSTKHINKMNNISGTLEYMAPEAFSRECSPKRDMWSIGIILFVLITGEDAYNEKNEKDTITKIKKGEYNRQRFIEREVSQECISFLDCLLQVDPKKRSSAVEALSHPWLSENKRIIKDIGSSLLTEKMVKNLINFKFSSLLQREMSYLMVQAFKDVSEIRTLQDIFLSIDLDCSGTIEKEEIIALAKSFSIELSPELTEEIIDSIYFKEKGVITFTEFEAGVLSKSFFVDKERLKVLFDYIDADQSGDLGPIDIGRCFKRFGNNLDEKKILRMIRESDFDFDGKISFEEFTRIMNDEVAIKPSGD